MDIQVTQETLTTAAYHLQATRCFQMSSFVMLLYDHLITLDVEIERIWKQRWSVATILFLINRYITPLATLIVLIAYNAEIFSVNVDLCQRFVRFEGAQTLTLVCVAEIIMIMRTYALMGRNNIILAVLGVIFLGQVCVCGWALIQTQRVTLPSALVGCILTGIGNRFIPFWAYPCLTDSIIFSLTIYRTRQYLLNHGRMPIIEMFQRDGVLYFGCILVANIANVIIFLTTTPDLKTIGATFSQLLTSVMISRLMLNLRSIAYKGDVILATNRGGLSKPVDEQHNSIMGNLGADIKQDDKFAEINVNTRLDGRCEEIPLYVMPVHVHTEVEYAYHPDRMLSSLTPATQRERQLEPELSLIASGRIWTQLN